MKSRFLPPFNRLFFCLKPVYQSFFSSLKSNTKKNLAAQNHEIQITFKHNLLTRHANKKKPGSYLLSSNTSHSNEFQDYTLQVDIVIKTRSAKLRAVRPFLYWSNKSRPSTKKSLAATYFPTKRQYHRR